MTNSSENISEDKVIFRYTAPPVDAPETDSMERYLAELVRYYRHSSVGRRCSGIIHNMNTPLQVISFLLELLEQKTQEEAALLADSRNLPIPKLMALLEYRHQKLKQFHEEIDHLHQMILRLALQGAHEAPGEQCYLDLNQIFQDELELYLANLSFKHRLEKEFTFSPSLPPIQGHYVDFSQSFRHLVDNALEAMVESPRRLLTVTTHVEKNCRVIRIGDTGAGIPPSVQGHLFQPFFTTKSTEETPRTGLGLYMTGRLLAPYEAEITIESCPGQTWVNILLPITK